jgi:hypothetical protein
MEQPIIEGRLIIPRGDNPRERHPRQMEAEYLVAPKAFASEPK